jgi:ketosteroid isomerase-like protein
MKTTTKSIVTDTDHNVVVINVQSRATTIGPFYDMEYIFILHTTPDAKALHRIEEFIDSATAKTQWARLQEAIDMREELRHG